MPFSSVLKRPATAGRITLLLVLLLLGLDCAFAESPYQLVLEDAAGATLYSTPVHNDSEFAIRYTHSVALTPVTDYFFIRNNSIWLDKTEYQDFGAGLPHAPEQGQQMRAENGKITISGYNRELGFFQLRVGRVASHILLVKTGKKWLEIPLDKLTVPGSAVTFIVRPTP